jgi:F0F1-type ATP synthase assembly protein I
MAEKNKPLPSLDALQRKIDSARPHGDEDVTPDSTTAGFGKAMHLGMELIVGVGVGGIIGYWIDQWLGTLPVFFILLFFLGFAAGLRNMLRSAKTMDKVE